MAIRQLAAAMQNRNLDLYRRLLAPFEHDLGEPEDRLHKQAERHVLRVLGGLVAGDDTESAG